MGVMLFTALIAAVALANALLAAVGDQKALRVTICGYWALVYLYWAIRTVEG